MAGCNCGTACETRPANPAYRRALWVALVLNAVMFGVELAASFRAESVSLLADAVDFLGDAGNYAVALFVLGLAPAWRSRTALWKGWLMLGYGVFVLGKSAWQWSAGIVPEPFIMTWVSLLALAVNVGVAVMLYLDAFAGLARSKQCAGEMWGAFDVTVGPLMECLVAGDGSPREPRPEQLAHARGRCGMHLYELDPVTHSVRIGDRVPLIDLGAIGKGYAVDRAVEMLKEWGVGSALVHSGTSSVFAYGALGDSAGWPVALRVPDYPWDVLERIVLAERAVSGSGTVRRRHIIDPRSGGPVLRRAAWASVASAAYSDALRRTVTATPPVPATRPSPS